jgi:peptidoglycan hydrolase-like protein with peptidoglycan-binding domain
MTDVSAPGASPFEDPTLSGALINRPEISDAKESATSGLGHGDQGAEVAQFQNRLIGLGAELEVNGIFGRETEAELTMFQRSQGLPASGRTDPATLAALEEVERTFTAEQRAGLDPHKPFTALRNVTRWDDQAVYRDVDGEQVIDHRATARKNLKDGTEALPGFLVGLGFGGFGGAALGGVAMEAITAASGSPVGAQAIGVGAVLGAAVGIGIGLTDAVQAGYHAIMAALGFGFQGDEHED